ETVIGAEKINQIRFSNIKAGFFKEGQINILTVARLHWIKGMEYILEALALLQEDGFNFKYTIAGDGEDRERLVFAVHQLGLVDRVIFLGKVSHADIPSLMRDNDLYIQYSIQEGFCNSVLEAQAAGMLCIVSDAAGLSENVIDDRTGWVVSKRRPDLLAKKIQEVINMPQDELLKVTRRATERIKSEFNLEKQREEFNAFYKELA
ncbi:MAG TPA: glycosyltransferase family 4 protein, partial [Saprospiraceae bacterium]|nr:glycosyltransferase family 4 protein [Saprospiraceae bacterium]